MTTFLQKTIANLIHGLRKTARLPEPRSRYDSGKEVYKMKVTAQHLVKDVFMIVIGIISAGFGLASFLLPNSFIDGGVTGISLLLAEVTNYPLPILIVIINIPFVVVGLTQMGRLFALKSIFAIIGLALAISFIHYPFVTSDKLLVSVFGGFFLGLGIGFAVRGGGVLDGTEVLAIYISKRTGFTIGDIILVFNLVIFSVAAYLLSVETALYSMLIYLVASKTVDFMIEGVEEYTGVTIVSPHNPEIGMMIKEKMGQGITVYTGQRGFDHPQDMSRSLDILYTVMTRLEIAKLKVEVDKIDPNAFMVMTPIKDMRGRMMRKKKVYG